MEKTKSMNKLANDVEGRVYKALVAYRVEAGAARADAEAWALARATQGAAIWKPAFDAAGDHDEGAMMAAYAALKTWARSQ